MSENASGRDYDLVLIGATGYTGALTAEHIAEHLPINLRWAIAGRSSTKLNGLAAKLKELGPDRIQPDPSGGTVESMMMRGDFDAKVQYESQQPWYLSPVIGRRNSSSTNLVGVRHDPTLGTMSASSLSDVQNRAVVHRTWGLLSGGMAYGAKFQYSEYKKASSTLAAMFQMLNTMAIKLMLALPPLRAIAAMVLPAPGQGPDPAKEKNYRFEMEAVAIADTDDDETAPRAYSHFAYPGGPYHATAAFLAQGQDLVERIRGVSTDFSTKIL
ncbi:hypothetical protein ACHAPE_009605 [Trichoderma viride]